MLTLTSARASSLSVLASNTKRKPGLSAPGFTTTLSRTPAASKGRRFYDKIGTVVVFGHRLLV